MKTSISPREIERKAYKSTFQDGLWDIFLGLVILGLAVPPWLSTMGVPSPLNDALLPLAAFLVLFCGKRWITIPRMGLVTFGPRRQADLRKTVVVLLLSLCVATALLATGKMQAFEAVGSAWGTWLAGYARPLGAGLLVMTVLSAMAYFMEFSRLYFIAALMGLSIPLARLLSNHVGAPLDDLLARGIPGAGIVVLGAVLLIRFLHAHPLLAEAGEGE